MTIDEYIAAQTETLQPLLRSVLQTLRKALLTAAEKIIAQYAGTLDLRPIANHQALTADGDKVDVISAEVKKKAAKEKK
jgi:hypothetical protein